MADTTWGVTDKGFYRPTIADIINEKNNLAKTLFGNDFDTSEQTPQGKFFRINAAAESELCKIAEGIYYSIAPSTARGISLDRVCETINLTRENAGYAELLLRVYGTSDYVIAAGTKFKNEAGLEFYSVQAATIEQEETTQDGNTIYYADVTVQCTQSGEVGNVRDVDRTSEVISDITSVMFQDVVAYGTPIESDPDLREKFGEVVQGLGTNTAAAIKANVLRVAGVNDVILIDNNSGSDVVIFSDLTVKNGTYAVIVHADSTAIDDDVAKAIFEKQPFGVPQSGVKSVTVEDNSGIEHTVKFTYVSATTINVTVACTTDNTFPSNGIDLIAENITSYINGLDIGQAVIYNRLYDYIYNVTGVYEVTDITLNGGRVNIPISKINTAKVGTVDVDNTEV